MKKTFCRSSHRSDLDEPIPVFDREDSHSDASRTNEDTSRRLFHRRATDCATDRNGSSDNTSVHRYFSPKYKFSPRDISHSDNPLKSNDVSLSLSSGVARLTYFDIRHRTSCTSPIDAADISTPPSHKPKRK